MGIAYLNRGGTPLPRYPACNSANQFDLDTTGQIGAEFALGRFTLSSSINLEVSEYQQAELARADIQVGDFIVMMNIPSRHYVSKVFGEVTLADPVVAGLEFEVVLANFDGITMDAPVSLSSPITLDATAQSFAMSPVPEELIPEGKSLVIGLKVKTLPTDANLSILDFRGVISLAAKVDGFPTVLHQ